MAGHRKRSLLKVIILGMPLPSAILWPLVPLFDGKIHVGPILEGCADIGPLLCARRDTLLLATAPVARGC